MYVKPAPGLQVRYPGTNEPLPAEGDEVAGTYWLRRLADGDVVLAPPPRHAKKPAGQE